MRPVKSLNAGTWMDWQMDGLCALFGTGHTSTGGIITASSATTPLPTLFFDCLPLHHTLPVFCDTFGNINTKCHHPNLTFFWSIISELFELVLPISNFPCFPCIFPSAILWDFGKFKNSKCAQIENRKDFKYKTVNTKHPLPPPKKKHLKWINVKWNFETNLHWLFWITVL